jgi:predicted metalloprotease with PDZ domain
MLRIDHARESIPVAPGPVALRFAKWIPGEHAPSGPIGDAVGFRFRAGDRLLDWSRDPIDPWLIRVVVPEGVDRLEVELDHLVPSEGEGFTASPSASARLAVLSWNELVLYPAEADPSALVIEPSLTLPDGWQAASALRVAKAERGTLRYAPVSLETLVDSPVATGANLRTIALAAPAGAPAHALHLFADSPEALRPEPEILANLEAHLVPETLALFGAHHYDRYDFLFTLSDHVGHFGLEHHASSDNRLPERTLLEPARWLVGAGLLPHEFVHSWNAKYRRPAGLATGDYHTPMVGDLLWVYEGLTSYLGDVLTARAGLVDALQTRESLALQAAGLAATRGRIWRPLLDTARDAQHAYAARDEGASWRRGVDFYDEGVMLWLEVDSLIREQTKGARSLDDFCRAFFGPPSGGAEVRPYDREALVEALAAVAPRDWEAFFHERVDALRPGPPIEGLEAAGWRLVYSAKPNAFTEAYAEEDGATLDLRFTLGLVLSREALVVDVVPGSPAEKARIGVGATLVAVDARAFTPTVLTEAIKHANARDGRLEFLVRNADYFTTHVVDYPDGLRHPHLVRLEKKTDWLGAILAPRTWTPPAKKASPDPDTKPVR